MNILALNFEWILNWIESFLGTIQRLNEFSKRIAQGYPGEGGADLPPPTKNGGNGWNAQKLHTQNEESHKKLARVYAYTTCIRKYAMVGGW